MKDTAATDIKLLHELIDELIVYANVLNKSPGDTQMIELFGIRLFRSGQLLYACGYSELSELARDIHSLFCRVYKQSVYATHEILRIVVSFLVLVRKALMFSGTPDFREIAEPMMLELRKSLQQVCKNTGIEQEGLQTGKTAGYSS